MSKRTKTTKKELTPAKRQKGIDMSHVPQSLINEGYLSEKAEEFPEYLKCPICKDLIVSPQMYIGCGHTVCHTCADSHMDSFCPVCKIPHYNMARIQNYALSQVIEKQYPEIYQKKTEELNERAQLKAKLVTYRRSTRYLSLLELFHEHIGKKLFVPFSSLVKHFVSKKTIKPPVTEDEVKYFLALTQVCFTTHWAGQRTMVIGSYIVLKMSDSSLISWLEKSKKDSDKKWSALMLFCRSPNSFQEKQKFAEIHGLDIGTELPLFEWVNVPCFWLRPITLEVSPQFHDQVVEDSEESDFDDGWNEDSDESFL